MRLYGDIIFNLCRGDIGGEDCHLNADCFVCLRNFSYLCSQKIQMEQKFSNNSLDLQVLREFCEREGEAVSYRKDITFEAKK